MTTISSLLATTYTPLSSHPSTSTHASKVSHFSSLHRSLFSKSPSCPYPLCNFPRKPKRIVSLKSSEAEEISSTGDEWLQTLPDKKKPLYSHSLPCIEAWLKGLGFYQSKESRAIWYLKNGPGNLEKDVERRFSYALSREDIENATLGGP
ncbi:hypothetical protein D5086_027884 [Populus alba]|uniref:Uncharacterized protein n=1 Tax=Populus alba TaxID=43335 RepID=A0ACC4AWS9_POPAL